MIVAASTGLCLRLLDGSSGRTVPGYVAGRRVGILYLRGIEVEKGDWDAWEKLRADRLSESYSRAENDWIRR